MAKTDKSNERHKSNDWKSKLDQRLVEVKAHTHTVITEMGIRPSQKTGWRDLPDIVKAFSTHNKTPAKFVRNLDHATYEIREKLKWNTKMASCLAFLKIKEKTLKIH